MITCIKCQDKGFYYVNEWIVEIQGMVDCECKTCTHADTTLVVLAIVHTCETTAIQCDDCGKILTEPKTDCR